MVGPILPPSTKLPLEGPNPTYNKLWRLHPPPISSHPKPSQLRITWLPPPSASLLPLLLLLLLLLLPFSSAEDTVWDVLEQNGLPRGLVPSSVSGYTVHDDGSFVVTLSKPCYVQFDYLVYYETTISGTISFGSIKNVKGIQAKALLFLWLDVTAIEADIGAAKVEFQIGSLTKSFPAKQFEKVPTCQKGVGVPLASGVPCGGRKGGQVVLPALQQLLLPDV